MKKIRAALLFVLLLFSPLALAQTPNPPAAAPNQQLLKPAELDALVAPIALYPDPLLSLVLMASTYPIEVVQADRWVKENDKLKGDQLKAAVDKQDWDDSVKSLVATPDVLSMMSTKLDWTQKLGDAVLAQQPDVMDAVQRLRARAQASNKLTTTKEQTVSRRQEQDREVIVIEPTDPELIYVPYFDPAVAYGDWPYPDYPPYEFGWPGYIPGALIATGLAFGTGYALRNWTSRGNYWGGGVNWRNNNININRPQVSPLNGTNWQHNPAHRQGVRYNNPGVQQKFGGGRGGQQGLTPGGGQRPSAGQRPSGERPSTGQRPSGGRPSAGKPSAGRPSAKSPSAKKPSAGKRPSGARPSASHRPSHARPSAGHRPSGARGGAAISRGGGGRGGAAFSRGGGGRGGATISRGGGGGGRVGGGGRGGGGRRSDIGLKHDIVLLGHLSNGIGFYRFSYNGSDQAYVGVMAQDVQMIEPHAVARGRDGYLRVFYERLGLKMQTYDRWVASGARIPSAARMPQ